MQRIRYQDVGKAGMSAIASVYQHVMTSEISRELLDLIFLRASQINGCSYCIDLHSNDLLKAGVSPQKLLLLSVWRETESLYTPEERAALQWVESITLVADTHAADADYEVVSMHFNEKQLVDLTIAIGLINVYNRIAIGFRRGPDNIR